jgi:hypothetical protein
MSAEPQSPEQRARSLIAGFAQALNVKAPQVRFVAASAGPCYEALFNRIEVDARTLALPDALLCIVLAHEVAHATQRRSMLFDFAWTGLGTMALLSVPCVMFATSTDDDIWRVSIPGLGFALAWIASWKTWRPHAAKRATAFELDADAKAAQLCGVASTLNALEAMSRRVHIEPVRLAAMRARLLSSCSTEQSAHS